MWQEDEALAQPPSQGMPGKEKDAQELAEEVYIPDYVMLDFGTFEVTPTNGVETVLAATFSL
jgi:hypothetical protein